MKKFYATWFYVSIFLLAPLLNRAQLNNGGINAFFGIDGDTKSQWSKYGPVKGYTNSDDWFSFTANTTNVIDTTNASYYLMHLSANENLGFIKGMSMPLYSKVNGKLWLDAAYGRDYVCTAPLVDSNAFTTAAKNGDAPGNWAGGITNFPDKNDLVDVYAHMRRDGTNVKDSLWLLTGVSTVGVSGSRYFDIELYKKSLSYSRASGTFTSAGTEAGHTEWIFDAAGKILQTGDLIVAVNYTPGSAPVVDVRIWISRTTYTTITPAYFAISGTLDGATPAYGYASVRSKTGTTAFGSGIANYSAVAANDTTFSTPWGTELSTKVWGANYSTLQLVEVGLNLTRMGIDPALYGTLSPCDRLFSNVFFKSRSSNSFLSNMQDFVEPLPFLKQPIMDYRLKPDTMNCVKSTGMLSVTSQTTNGYYTWNALTGAITGSNSDSTQVNISGAGTYIVTGAPALGCPATRKDTIVVMRDTFPPVATAFTGLGTGSTYIQFYGGDPVASNYMTPFGGSQGLLWNWSGPGGFTAAIQNPTNDTVWGTYQLIVTEKRNGCKDTALIPVHYDVFVLMAQNMVTLQGQYAGDDVFLKWQGKGVLQADTYTIEKSTNGIDYKPIAVMTNNGTDDFPESSVYHYTDGDPVMGNNFYRIKLISKNGVITYSNVTLINAKGTGNQKIFLSTDLSGTRTTLNISSASIQQATLVFYTVTGELLGSTRVTVNPGLNQFSMDNGDKTKAAKLVTVFMNNERVFTGKLLK